jgi:hypothetical protein
MDAVEALKRLGYHLEADGSNIRFRYTGPGRPPADARPLIEELRQRKPEALAHLQGQGGQPLPPAETTLDETLPAHLLADLVTWPSERQALWRRRVAAIIEETGWPLPRVELAAYWDCKRWWLFLMPERRTLH